ncbi:unnamed protein product, partial [Pylaiella littoralis]
EINPGGKGTSPSWTAVRSTGVHLTCRYVHRDTAVRWGGNEQTPPRKAIECGDDRAIRGDSIMFCAPTVGISHNFTWVQTSLSRRRYQPLWLRFGSRSVPF